MCSTPAAAAAWMRERLASRSIASGLGLPGPANPCTAETTVAHSRTAAATAAGSRRSPVMVWTVSGRSAARVGSRVSTRTSWSWSTSSRTSRVPSVPVPPDHQDHHLASSTGVVAVVPTTRPVWALTSPLVSSTGSR